MTSPLNASTIAGRVRNLANLHKPHIEINLEAQSQAIPSFSTFDKIEGNVVITAPFDTVFDTVEIALVGKSSYSKVLALAVNTNSYYQAPLDPVSTRWPQSLPSTAAPRPFRNS